jgi:hypothetical protein
MPSLARNLSRKVKSLPMNLGRYAQMFSRTTGLTKAAAAATAFPKVKKGGNRQRRTRRRRSQ